MSPADDRMLDEIRHARDRLRAAGRSDADSDIAAELGITEHQLHAAMRQLFSDGRRIDAESSEPPSSGA